jgi:hypothetical protein
LPTYPERIVCLTEETTETLYLLGEGHRVEGFGGPKSWWKSPAANRFSPN